MSEASTGYVGRFAPSPTGPLHFGSLAACLASYLDAKANGGIWLLRIEDVDVTRCKQEFAVAIIQTLSAFGFVWDREIVFQHDRTACYQAALDRLTAQKLTYACACSRREIADSAVSGVDGPVYPGTCRHKGITFSNNALRIVTSNEEISFIDRVQGPVCQRLASEIGDFIVKRRDALFAYQLAVVVDDADENVSHVVRGADLLDSTVRQIYLQQLLGSPTPHYLHIPVAVNEAGQKLSKQTLAPAISAADACRLLCDALAFLGQTRPDRSAVSPTTLLDAAVRNWHPDAIPKRRSSYIS